MCLDPDPDPASHNVNLACYGCLEGYLPVVGPGQSLAVAMVADSDSSRGKMRGNNSVIENKKKKKKKKVTTNIEGDMRI